MEADFSDNGADYEDGEEAPTPSDGGATPVQDERDFGSDSEGEQLEPYNRSAPGPGSESGDEEGEDHDDADDGDDVGQALSRSHSDEGERSDDGERYDEGERESVDGDRDSPEGVRDSAEEAEEPENEEREEGERTDSESEAEGAGPPARPYEGAARKEEAMADSDRESQSSTEEVGRQHRDPRSDDEEDDLREDEEEEEQGGTSAKRKADVDSEDEEGEVDKSPVKRSRLVSDNEEEDSDREFEPKGPEPVAESGSGSEDEALRSSPPPAKHSRLILDDEEEAEPAETRNDEDPLEADHDGDDSGVEEGGAAVAAVAAAAAAAAASVKRRRGSDSESDAGEDEDGGGGRGGEAEGKPAARRARVVSDSEDDEAAQKEERRVEQEAPARKPIVSDSEDDDDAGERRRGKEPPAKKAVLSDSEEEEERQAEQEMPTRKPKVMDSDSESGSDDAAKVDDEKTKTKEKQIFGSDSDSADEAGVGILIADIFGDSDNEEEEFTGFGQEELEKETSALGKDPSGDKDKDSEYDSDEGVRGGNDTAFISDFDLMLKRKREMNRRQRRGNRDGGTFISDVDDLISAMITRMNEAAEEDKKLNLERKPALKKMVMLPTVIKHLRKQDLVESFIDSGILSAIRDWLCPLPDKSLPNLKIREELLKVLQDLPSVPQETLKSSGIGRSVMYLYKHPKETRQNKDLAGKLINEWSRPIFGLTSNYKGMSREEREQRDLEQMPHRRRLSSGGQTPRRDLDKVLTGEEKALRPGDPGFCSRARVPMPSNRDYVIRPKWNVEADSNRGSVKKGINRVEKQMKKFADKRRSTKGIRAVKISVEGNHMPL